MSDLENLQQTSIKMLGTMPIPKISAIVSAYYAEKYLEGRIQNLINQSIPVEIIVICQVGSEEEQIALSHLSPSVIVIQTLAIPTIYAAWNMGIKMSHGEYLTSANCDDRLKPFALATLTHILDKNPAFCLAYGNQEIVEEIDGPVVERFQWAVGGLDVLLHGCFVGPQPVWRRSLHEKYGYFDEEMQVAGDYEFWLRIMAGGERFYHSEGFVGQYLRRKDSREARESLRTIWETARARARHCRREVIL
jgi:glycosyltransferase involved in cell wall biosynthesis